MAILKQAKVAPKLAFMRAFKRICSQFTQVVSLLLGHKLVNAGLELVSESRCLGLDATYIAGDFEYVWMYPYHR